MIQIIDDKLRISVRSLVEFLCREGDLDSRRGGVSDQTAMGAGTRAHKKIQQAMGPDYRAEVALSIRLPGEEYEVIIEGRADGIFETEDAVFIDEIKGTYADIRYFPKAVPVHRAQALCYAYIYMMEQGLDCIGVRMTYVNLEYENVRYFEEILGRKELSEWFDELVRKLRVWGDYVIAAKKERNATIEKLEFPYPYREGQHELAASVYRALNAKRNLFIQAPTGVGKTISTVFPSIKSMAMGKGEKLFYLTAKTITRTVAEETFALLRTRGLIFKTVTITAKEKVCPMCGDGEPEEGYEKLEHPSCNPSSCPYAKGHFDRVNDAVYDLITHEEVITREVIETYARKHRVCAFEFTLDVSYWMDGVICDYNYAFDPHVHLKRFFTEGVSGDYIFLVDEAHNLVDRARDMYSASVYKEQLLRGKALVNGKDKKLAAAFERCNRNLLTLKKECPDEYRVLKNGEESQLSLNLMRLQEELSRFMEEHRDFEEAEELSEIFFDVMHYNDMQEKLGGAYVVYEEHTDDGFMVRLFCVNPSENLGEYLSCARSGIFFSATLLPVSYYKELLSGNREDYAIYAHSVFNPDRRLLLIGRDVTSRYTHRNESEYLKIRNYLHRVADGRPGNYFAFFPSYKVMQEVYELCLRLGDDERYELIMQEKVMKEEAKERFLAAFEEQRKKSLIAFVVLGGSFSEGIDLKHERLIGTVIVGTGLPAINTAGEILKAYYDEKEHCGYEYAYVYPGMNKVLQAAGRVIRTEEDYGVVALLDDRFLTSRYRMLFPREWEKYRIVTGDTVSQDILDFWEGMKYNT